MEGQSKTGYLYDEIFLKHDTGIMHPENPGRLEAIYSGLKEQEWFDSLVRIPAAKAEMDVVTLVHSHEYYETAQRDCSKGYSTLTTGDTNICESSFYVALHAVGGIINAVDMVMDGRLQNAFCAVRPPGHHATPDVGMGFCIFNNIAIAARYAQEKYGIEKVLIADWDVHHGNGTQDAFYSDNTVLFFSTHQSPFYPGTGSIYQVGTGKGEGFTINRPFSYGTGNEEIIDVFKNNLLTTAKEFRPDLTLISAGFDSRIDDMLGGFLITDDGFRKLTKIMMEIAEINGNGRLISILEGGYTHSGLTKACTAHVETLLDC